jgi:ERCC4-type nuclease
MVTVCVDNRERERILTFKEYIKTRKAGIIDNIENDNYDTGDVFTKDGLVGIEYKGDDFLPSVFDHRLDKQLKELRDNFHHHYLFIGYEGISDMIMKNIGTNPAVIYEKLGSVLARTETTIMFVGDMFIPFACKVIECHYDGKTLLKEMSYTPIRRAPRTDEIQLDMLNRIPNLGPIKAKKLLEKYHSISAIAQVDIEELKQMKGIGNTLASRIKHILN